MSIKKVSKESIVPNKIEDGLWSGSNIAEIFPVSGDTKMSCGIHEIFASDIVVEKSPVDDILYILEGEIEISADGVVNKYKAGDFAYLYAGSRQTFTIRNRVKHIYITYPRDWSGE